MSSVASLLNPIPLITRKNIPQPIQFSSPTSTTTQPSSITSSPLYSTVRTPLHTRCLQTQIKQKMVKDGAVFAKGKIKGTVNFPPFEAYDPASVQQIQKFGIWPNNGNMQEYARHIPYNSEKKSFLDKTGRESFEVFQYIFRVPDDEKEYTVMWDYNIGLVRITPFFKCLKYSKTTPAKMLNANHGLKEITHSITGGALAAQGYWMPFACAQAVCFTFCAPIAGALIPIFGPNFPSRCISASSPLFGRMIMDPAIVQASTAEANRFRQHYSALPLSSFPSPTFTTPGFHSPSSIPSSREISPRSQASVSPRQSRAESPTLPFRKRLRLRRPYTNTSSPSSDTDHDASNSPDSSSSCQYMHTPPTPVTPSLSSFSYRYASPAYEPHTPNTGLRLKISREMHQAGIRDLPAPPHLRPMHNAVPIPNPWLSAIPRSANNPVHPSSIWRSRAHEGQERKEWKSPSVSPTSNPSKRDLPHDGEDSGVEGLVVSPEAKKLGAWRCHAGREDEETGGAEKRAAWLLMKLSVGESDRPCLDNLALAAIGIREGLVGGSNCESPRSSKRKRATSW